MKNFFTILVFISATVGATAQSDLTGKWNGEIMSMPLVFDVMQTDDGYKAAMQSPKQSKVFLPADEVMVKGDSLTIKINAYKITFKGKLENGEVNGEFKQGPAEFPLVLQPGDYKEPTPNRPQEPTGDVPYKITDVKFENPYADGVTLAGTLTTPAGVKNPSGCHHDLRIRCAE